ncbi:MAG TPA: methionine--tRNA ligase [Spirochaetales bacterium]|nr:methionine--tRNA ligase [Spirochaetales bacterium]HPS14391.1 methionine--tRNA ligase [Spirochaetales bacterium]
MKRRLVTSALPYVNNVPHLGNLIQVLSADVFARFCRLRGYDTLYICGTDEYGTATETKAQEEGVTPRELCDRYHALHEEIYNWFNISFDKFGRTSAPEQTEVTQGIFLDLYNNGYITSQTVEQLYCDSCGRFLADRYVRGTCPSCGYDGARGDQCENCGKLLEPTDLINPVCSTCGSTPHLKSTTHLYIDLPKILPKLEPWIQEISKKGFWSNNAIQMTQAWLRDGLRPRAITRDLKWGIPVPLAGYEDKVFYVWFDAPIGYISMTVALAKEKGFDWKSWWQNPNEVELFQFIGKDNIPFHTVVFPSSLLGSGRNWTMLHHMSSTEYLNYESGKFSKSKGIGVFGNDVMETGIPADVWRFYIFWNRPETSDFTFVWSDFRDKVNGELIGNLGNLVNRTLTFVSRYYEGTVPVSSPDSSYWEQITTLETKVTDALECADLRDAFHGIFEISDIANKRFQDGEPWKTRTSEPEKAAQLLGDLCYTLRDLAILLHPYLPNTAERLAGFLGLTIGKDGLDWSMLGQRSGLGQIGTPEVLFTKLEEDVIARLRERYSGSQKERLNTGVDQTQIQKTDKESPKETSTGTKEEKGTNQSPKPYADLSDEERFEKLIDLRVAKIVQIDRHPKADKLYIEHLDDGTGKERVIVSGLVPYYREEELLGKNIVLVNNLKPAKLRGIESQGMLLAASIVGPEGKEAVEVLTAPWAEPGTKVVLSGSNPRPVREGDGGRTVVSSESVIEDVKHDTSTPETITADMFFSVPIRAQQGFAVVGQSHLSAAGRDLILEKVQDGEIG